MRWLPTLTLLIELSANATAQVSPATVLRGELTRPGFVLRYRPGSRAAASVPYVATCIEREFADITGQLEMTYRGRFEVFLYDDPGELGFVTGVDGVGGFASGAELHIPYDNEQTRYHELVHVIADQLASNGPEHRSLFFVEGLANALMVYTHHLHAHTAAAFERRRGRLPALRALVELKDFYAWHAQHPDFFGYDVAASYLLYLRQQFGVEKLKRYYQGVPAEKVYGQSLEQLERGWHEVLDEVEILPETRDLMRRRSGEQVRFSSLERDLELRLPELARRGQSDWQLLPADAKNLPEGWSFSDQVVEARPVDGDQWQVCSVAAGPLGNGVLRATLDLDAGSCAQLSLGPEVTVQLVANGCFLFDGVRYSAVNPNEGNLSGRVADCAVIRIGAHTQVWLDGYLVVEGPTGVAAGAVQIGVLGAACRFQDLAFRPIAKKAGPTDDLGSSREDS